MTDCPNAEIRDRLPDLLHDRLDSSERAAVMAHVDGCEDCREELEVLRGARRAITAGTPRVDISAIVYALPKPPARSAATTIAARSGRRPMWTDWRIAAAVAFIAVGGGSAMLLSRGQRAIVTSDTERVAAVAPTTPAVATPTTAMPESAAVPPSVVAPRALNTTKPAPVATAAVPDQQAKAAASEVVASSDDQPVGPTSHLTDLSQRQLKALLNDIEGMKAVPLTDPEPVSIKLDTKVSSSSDPEGW